jgi:hypothetical protein
MAPWPWGTTDLIIDVEVGFGNQIPTKDKKKGDLDMDEC